MLRFPKCLFPTRTFQSMEFLKSRRLGAKVDKYKAVKVGRVWLKEVNFQGFNIAYRCGGIVTV